MSHLRRNAEIVERKGGWAGSACSFGKPPCRKNRQQFHTLHVAEKFITTHPQSTGSTSERSLLSQRHGHIAKAGTSVVSIWERFAHFNSS